MDREQRSYPEAVEYPYDARDERAMILERFLSRRGISRLGLGRDGGHTDWFRENEIDFTTRETASRKLADDVTSISELRDALNSSETEPGVYPWFLGEVYRVKGLEDRLEVLRQHPQERASIYEQVRVISLEYPDAGRLLYGISEGVERPSSIENDVDGLVSDTDLSQSDAVDPEFDPTEVAGVVRAGEGSEARYRIAKELAPVVRSAVLSVLGAEECRRTGRSLPSTPADTGRRTEDNCGDDRSRDGSVTSAGRSTGADGTDGEKSETVGVSGSVTWDTDSSVASRELRVVKAYPNDSARGIARLDPDTLLHLKLSPGDTVEIEGSESTVARAWRADREDWNEDLVRIDGFTRQNAEAGLGETVTVRKSEPADADEIVLTAPVEADVGTGAGATGAVKRRVLKRPVREGDVVPVMSSTNHPFMRSPGQAVPFVATETDPGGVVTVTEDTEIVLREDNL